MQLRRGVGGGSVCLRPCARRVYQLDRARQHARLDGDGARDARRGHGAQQRRAQCALRCARAVEQRERAVERGAVQPGRAALQLLQEREEAVQRVDHLLLQSPDAAHNIVQTASTCVTGAAEHGNACGLKSALVQQPLASSRRDNSKLSSSAQAATWPGSSREGKALVRLKPVQSMTNACIVLRNACTCGHRAGVRSSRGRRERSQEAWAPTRRRAAARDQRGGTPSATAAFRWTHATARTTAQR
eukprot:6045025-Pleurochrysis_carterae.AAC.1